MVVCLDFVPWFGTGLTLRHQLALHSQQSSCLGLARTEMTGCEPAHLSCCETSLWFYALEFFSFGPFLLQGCRAHQVAYTRAPQRPESFPQSRKLDCTVTNSVALVSSLLMSPPPLPPVPHSGSPCTKSALGQVGWGGQEDTRPGLGAQGHPRLPAGFLPSEGFVSSATSPPPPPPPMGASQETRH